MHKDIWRDEEVKCVHYILAPKPWDEYECEEKIECGNTVKCVGRKSTSTDESHRWWQAVNEDRLRKEKEAGIDDGF